MVMVCSICRIASLTLLISVRSIELIFKFLYRMALPNDVCFLLGISQGVIIYMHAVVIA